MMKMNTKRKWRSLKKRKILFKKEKKKKNLKTPAGSAFKSGSLLLFCCCFFGRESKREKTVWVVDVETLHMTTRTQLGSFLFLAQFLLLDGYSSKVCRHQRKKKFIHSRKRKEKKKEVGMWRSFWLFNIGTGTRTPFVCGQVQEDKNFC